MTTRRDEDTARLYVLRMTDGERTAVLGALNEHPAEAGGSARAALADRIEREHGEDNLLSLATSRLRAWYYGTVRDLAEDCLRSILDGSICDTEGLDRWISETVDGTDLVVYTFKAKCVLLASDNEDAADEHGFENPTTEARAFCAIEADVLELLRAFESTGSDCEGAKLPEGFDLNDPDTWKAAPAEEVES